MPHIVEMPPFVASDEFARLDFDVVHGFLTACYWSEGIPRATVEKAAANSISFGVYDMIEGGARGGRGAAGVQVGFCRVVTDRATYGYLADVFVVESHRGRGASKLMMRCVMSHPELQGLRRWMLMTRDAHGLYGQFGFAALPEPGRAMEINRRGMYLRGG